MIRSVLLLLLVALFGTSCEGYRDEPSVALDVQEQEALDRILHDPRVFLVRVRRVDNDTLVVVTRQGSEVVRYAILANAGPDAADRVHRLPDRRKL